MLCDTIADDAQALPVAVDGNLVVPRFWNVDLFVLRFGGQARDHVTDDDVGARRRAHNRDQARVLPRSEADALRGRGTGAPAIRGQPRRVGGLFKASSQPVHRSGEVDIVWCFGGGEAFRYAVEQTGIKIAGTNLGDVQQVATKVDIDSDTCDNGVSERPIQPLERLLTVF